MLCINLFLFTIHFSVFYLQFDVTFPALPCSLLSLDAMDISGEQHLDVVRIVTYPFLKICKLFEIELCRACHVHVVQDLHIVSPFMQKHDIIKKRLDSHGNAIEARPDGIGAPKVCNVMKTSIPSVTSSLSGHLLDHMELI